MRRVQAPPALYLSQCTSQPAGGFTGQEPAPDPPSSIGSSQGHRSHPDAFFFFFFFCPTQSHEDLSCSFGYIRDPLPVSSWFSVRTVPQVDVFLMWGEVSSTSSFSTILIQSFLLFYSDTFLFPYF